MTLNLDSVGRLLIIAFFAIVWVRNLSSHHIEDHVKRLTFFKSPLPRATFWLGMGLDAVGCVLLLAQLASGDRCAVPDRIYRARFAVVIRFWEMDDPMKRTGMQNGFLANIGIVGGLLLLLQNVT